MGKTAEELRQDLEQHRESIGRDMEAIGDRVSPGRMGPHRDVYSPKPFSWSEPETRNHRPEFTVPKGGGFDFECSWHNTTTRKVEFGESANAEMCFFWAYYYPSQGSKVCFHTDELGGVNGPS